ncbi:hypothetical protein HK096_009940, partial [Nowakowskiella sp. JEL0078]
QQQIQQSPQNAATLLAALGNQGNPTISNPSMALGAFGGFGINNPYMNLPVNGMQFLQQQQPQLSPANPNFARIMQSLMGANHPQVAASVQSTQFPVATRPNAAPMIQANNTNQPASTTSSAPPQNVEMLLNRLSSKISQSNPSETQQRTSISNMNLPNLSAIPNVSLMQGYLNGTSPLIPSPNPAMNAMQQQQLLSLLQDSNIF